MLQKYDTLIKLAIEYYFTYDVKRVIQVSTTTNTVTNTHNITTTGRDRQSSQMLLLFICFDVKH